MDTITEGIMGGYMWWWIIHHSVHNYDLVFGHFPYHKPQTEWTDDQLGVPHDSEGLAPIIENIRSTEVQGCTNHQLLLPPLLLRKLYGDDGIWKF